MSKPVCCEHLRMYLRDNNNSVIDSEFSLDVLDGGPCVVIESSGGASRSQDSPRRNPEYNKLLGHLLQRLATLEVAIAGIVLDSRRVFELPISDRMVQTRFPYPVDLSKVEIESFRLSVGRAVASMHQAPNATKRGNAQKRLRILLSRIVKPEELACVPENSFDSVDGLNDFESRLSLTEREYLSTARIGQGDFRRRLHERFPHGCPITGITNHEVLIASHIKPWRACSNEERLDHYNGLLFSALIDRLFDRGLISFEASGRLMVSPHLSPTDVRASNLNREITIAIPQSSLGYLLYHRVYEFRS
jgi:hypothetical protein